MVHFDCGLLTLTVSPKLSILSIHRSMSGHFFTAAPVISWNTWLWRKLWGIEKEPSLMPNLELPLELPKLDHTLYELSRCDPAKAKEYTKFLNKHYYSEKDTQLNLYIPAEVIVTQLHLGRWQGIEIRERQTSRIIGVVFSLYAGSFKNTPMGLITWLCVRPEFRKQGFTNILLRAMYAMNQPTTIYWWRTDGWLQSPCPPVTSEPRLVRRAHCHSSAIHFIHRHETPDVFVAEWKRQNPSGFLLYAKGVENPFLSIYEYRHSQTEYVMVAFQPTFEKENRVSDRTYSEIVGWVVSERLKPMNAAMYIEILLDEVFLAEWYEAPASMPHLDSKGWKAAGTSAWSVLGLDPGTASSLPILALAAA